ncbi:MAG: TIGR04255 family protein [Oscillospiraceae bacterium]|nr:TIGR04255 family protein [Oscillospiraceae bacterium]
MFHREESAFYQNNQIVNVICQLRFPTILAIGAKAPFEFQDAVRKEYPQYQLKKEQPAPKLVNRGGVITPEKQELILNHTFSTADGGWTLNLTSGFIALSTTQYEDWETFAHRLDWALAAFFAIYQPAYFERIGLRYINGFSKRELGAEQLRWSDLLEPAFTGLMAEEDVQEGDFSRCTQDAELRIRGGCRAKIHTGPGLVKHGGVQEKEPRYILDLDVSMAGQVQLTLLTGALQTVHQNAVSLFRGAITDELHDAMDPR